MGMRVIKPDGIWRTAACLLIVVLLAGCAAGNGASSGTAGEGNVPLTSASTLPGATTAAEAPEPAATAAPLSLDILATPDAQPTPVAVDESALESELIGAPLTAESGRLGTVRGLFLDVSTGQGQYLLVDAEGSSEPKTFLLPWGMFTITRQELPEATPVAGEAAAAAPTGAAATAMPGVELVLSPQASQPLEAPGIDPDLLERWQQGGELPAGWDGAARRYWSAYLLDNHLSGQDSGPSAGPVFYLGEDALNSERWQVRDEDGKRLGQVQDLFLAPDGAVSFAALYLPKFREQDDLSVVAPWKTLVWEPNIGAFFLAATADKLAGAPVFERAALPDISVPGWDQEWQQYWQPDRQASSQTPAQTEQRGQSLVSALLGRSMQDVSGQEIGVVQDLVMGSGGGILYLVLSSGERILPVPWIMFDYSGDALIYIDDPMRLEDAPSFSSGAQIDPSNPDWDKEIRAYWGLGR